MKVTVSFLFFLIVGCYGQSDEFIAEINAKAKGQWIAARNNFTSSPPIFGTLREPKRVKAYRKNFEVPAEFELPETFDARTHWPECNSISMIWDQGECGACWAISAAAAMSDRICIAKGTQTLVSAYDIVTCCEQCGQGDGCNGGSPFYAWAYWVFSGIPSGGPYHDDSTCRPYDVSPCDHYGGGHFKPCAEDYIPTPKCIKKCTNGAEYDSDKSYGQTFYEVEPDEFEIMREISTNGPVQAAFSGYEDILHYKSGVYSHVTGKYLGIQGVRIIGWGVENGKKYWIIANSWNEYWGDKGTFKILRGVDECDIESNGIFAGTPK